MYYLNARYYDPTLGRFLTRDPDGGNQTDRLSLNPYIYVKNNPINEDDPDGHGLWGWVKKKYNQARKWVDKKISKPKKTIERKVQKAVKTLSNSKLGKALKSVTKSVKKEYQKFKKNPKKYVKEKAQQVGKTLAKAGNTLSKAYSSSPGSKTLSSAGKTISQGTRTISQSPTAKKVAKVATAVFDKITGTGTASAWTRDVHEGTPGGPRYKNENTYSWAKEVGFTSTQAKTIAKANMDVDRAWLTEPQKGMLGGPMHFDWIPGRIDSRGIIASTYLQKARDTGDLKALGAGLHSVQDKYSHRGLGTPFPSLLTLTPFYALGPAQISHLYLSARGRSPDDASSHPQGIARTEAATKAYLESYFND